MKLTQKKFLLPTFEFFVLDHALHVQRSTLTSANSFEVLFRDLDPSPSEQRNLALGWYILGGLLLLVGLALVGGSFEEMPTDSRMGLYFGAAIAGLPGVLCLLEAHKRTFAYIIFHSARNGSAWIYIRKKSPSELHVREFVEIIKEKIAAEIDESKREKA